MDQFVVSSSQHHAAGPLGSFLIFVCSVGIGGAIACFGLVAEGPPPGLPPQGEATLQSLQMLVNDAVYAIHGGSPSLPRGRGPRSGAGGAQLLAKIHDAHFDRAGRLLALQVAAPGLRGAAEPLRILPASAVAWDTARRQWVVTEPNLELTELDAGGFAEPALQPAVLASQLLRADVAPLATNEACARAVGAHGSTEPPRPPIVWISPTAQRLALVVVPLLVAPDDSGELPSTRHVPVPWSLVRATPRDDAAVIEVAASAELLATAPACIDPHECPLTAFRQSAYEYFGVAAPAWDDPFEIVARSSRR